MFSFRQACSALSVLALSLSVAACGGSSGSESSQPSSGEFTYTINRNGTVSAFRVDLATGTLKRLKESPFVTSGKDSIAGTIDLSSIFLFVTNQGSGDVSVFKILSNGALKLVPGAPFFSGSGARSAVVTADERFLFVANTLADSISAFSVDINTGALAPLAGSPFSTGAGSAPSSLALDPIRNFLYVADAGTNNVLALGIAADGSLSRVAGSPFPSGINPSAIGINPIATFLYTANFGGQSISAFLIEVASGALTSISGSPFQAGSGPSATAIDPSGLFLYLTNANDQTVSGYNIDAKTGSLSPVTGSPFGAGLSPSGAVVDNAGKFLWIANQASDNVSGYRIDHSNGTLSPLPGSPFSVETGSSPGGIVRAFF